jgi:cell wall assembly regulator SMI1
VDRTKRHTDKQLVAHFWRSLDAWVARNKPDLAPRGAVEAR